MEATAIRLEAITIGLEALITQYAVSACHQFLSNSAWQFWRSEVLVKLFQPLLTPELHICHQHALQERTSSIRKLVFNCKSFTQAALFHDCKFHICHLNCSQVHIVPLMFSVHIMLRSVYLTLRLACHHHAASLQLVKHHEKDITLGHGL